MVDSSSGDKPIFHSDLIDWSRNKISVEQQIELAHMTRNGVLAERSRRPSTILSEAGITPTELPTPAIGQTKQIDSGFRFGKQSQENLKGVRPELVSVAELAIKLSTQDFMIFDGLRTIEEQKRLLATGMTKTLKSYHLRQASGYGHAIDCVPVVGSIPKWDWELTYPVVWAIDQAATQLGVADRIVWGGAWDRRLSDFGGSEDAYRAECRLYAARHPGTDFIDGPHFQWMGS